MAYCFMSTEKIKSIGGFTRKFEHNYRTGIVHNSDPNRVHLNEEVLKLPDGKTYADCFRTKMAEIGHMPRKNAVLGIEIMMTYNSSKVNEDFDIDKWKEANIKWLKENFPEDGILSVVMHRDEGPDNGKSAHLHAVVLPIYEGKLNCKHYLSGRKKLIDLQDSYGKAMKPLGLERGLEGSTATHQTIRQFYDTVNKAIEENIPEREEDENFDDYYERVNIFYKDSNLKNLHKTKELQREIDELKTHLKMARVEAQVDAREIMKDATKEKEKIEKEKKIFDKNKAELDAKLDELRNVESRIRNFNTLMSGLKHHPDETFVESLTEDIQTMIDWEREYEENLDKQVEQSEKQETDVKK